MTVESAQPIDAHEHSSPRPRRVEGAPVENAQSIDVDGIIAYLRKLLTAGLIDEVLEQVAALLKQMKEQNNSLQMRLLKALRQHFGRKSEKLSPDQLGLFLASVEGEQGTPGAPLAPAESTVDSAPSTVPAPASNAELPTPKPQPRKGHGRKPLPASLPREERVLPVPADKRSCTLCGSEKSCMGYERSEVLEFIPAGFKVIVNAQEKLVCRACEGDIVIAPSADKPIEGGRPGPGLLAQVLVAKYGEHIPLHRQSQIYKRYGVDLSVSTLVDWVAASTDMLAPLVVVILNEALISYVLQSDDTGICVLDRDHPNGAKRGHFWFYVGDKKWSAFVYTPNWKAEGPQAVLAKRKGWLLIDGYAGYGVLFTREGATAVEVGCWAHCRHYFFDALATGDDRAAVAIAFIGQIFLVDHRAKDEGLGHEELLLRRQRDAAPAFQKLGRWMADLSPHVPPKSSLGQAIGYATRRWTALSRFLEDGRLPLHNGLSELQARLVAVGRKNYLFAGSDKGAERAAIAYTLISTCLLNNVEPWAYLRDVLDKLASGWPQSRLAELLPPNWAKHHAQQQSSPTPKSLVPL